MSFESLNTKLLIAALVILLAALQYKLWASSGGISETVELQAQVHSQQQRNDQLRDSNDRLRAEVRDLKTGYHAIDERARNDLGMIQQGETFYQIVK